MRPVPRLSKPPTMPAEVLAIISAIGNSARTEMLRHLSSGAMSTRELADAVGVDHSRILRHLAVLEDLDLVIADHPRGQRRGVGRVVLWTTNRKRVEELGRRWTAYATGRRPSSAAHD
ncbi:MAG: ArsR family transcriptional regulator [Nocardioides sp.]